MILVKHPDGRTPGLWCLTTHTLLAMSIIDNIFKKYGYNMRVTWVCNGVHGQGSLHSQGDAFDFGTKEIGPAAKHQIMEECQAALPEYDVILEDEFSNNEHGHAEYDPKADEIGRGAGV